MKRQNLFLVGYPYPYSFFLWSIGRDRQTEKISSNSRSSKGDGWNAVEWKSRGDLRFIFHNKCLLWLLLHIWFGPLYWGMQHFWPGLKCITKYNFHLPMWAETSRGIRLSSTYFSRARVVCLSTQNLMPPWCYQEQRAGRSSHFNFSRWNLITTLVKCRYSLAQMRQR